METASKLMQRLEINSNSMRSVNCEKCRKNNLVHNSKRDLIRALEFVFGANLKRIQAESPKQLVHRALWKELEEENTVPCFVEVTLESLSEKEPIKFHRGVTNRDLEYKIDDKSVSSDQYEKKLNSLDLSVNIKNIIFDKNLFYEAIWGNPEDLEKTVMKILRATSGMDEWKKTKDKLKYFQERKKILANQNFKRMKKSHRTIEKFVNTFNIITMKRVCFEESMNLDEILDEESPLSGSIGVKAETSGKSFYEALHEITLLEAARDSLRERYRSFEKKEKSLCSELFFNKVKIFSNPANINILQDEIIKLKGKLRVEENRLPSLWIKLEETDNQLKDLNRKITNDLGHLWDLRKLCYLKNRITLYGRFIDYLQPNHFVNILRKILGEEIIYSNLCDDMPSAVFYANLLKGMKYKGRENFLIFKNYSPKLKDLLLASGEKGIKIENIRELQIFLCKLKQYELISSVPLIVGRKFNFKLEEGKNYDEDIIYPTDGIFLKSDGLIIYSPDLKETFEIIESLLDRINSMLKEQALKYEEYREIIFTRFETLRIMADLENDILYLKSILKKHATNSSVESVKRQKSSVYDPNVSLFKKYDQLTQYKERQMEHSDDNLPINKGNQSLTLEEIGYGEAHESVGRIPSTAQLIFQDARQNEKLQSLLTSKSAVLDEIISEMIKTKEELAVVERKLRVLDLTYSTIPVQAEARFPVFKQPKMVTYLYYEKQLENLKLTMSTKEVEEFQDWKDWRKEVIESFIQDTGTTDDSLKALEAVFERITTSRKKILSPLMEHCSHHLTSTLKLMMDISLPFLDLTMNQSEDRLQLLTSSSESLVNLIDISNLNTFLKFIAALSLFLEIAVFDKIPLLFLEDMEEFLPSHNDNFETVISENTLKRILTFEGNARFQILTRIAQFFDFFIKKNSAGRNIRKNGNKTGINGPAQIIYFTNGDLSHFTEHKLWIQSRLLPDEYATSDCDMYSFLQEIHLKLSTNNTDI